MKLNKRYLRNIKENLPFYLSASILTAVGLVLFFLFYIAGTGISAFGEKFFAENKVEDASFTTYIEIPDDKLAELENNYNATLEKERYVNQKEDGFTARVFVPNGKIDLYEIKEGRSIENADEILISAGYAEENGVTVGGEKMVLRGKEYTVVGTFLRPDYLYMLENMTDDYKNVTTFFLAYMDEGEFTSVFGAGSYNYKVVYHDHNRIADFRKAVNADYYVSSYLSADNNARITFVDGQAQMFILAAWVMLVMLPFVTVALISIMIGRKIRSEQKVIGTLSALGYTKKRLTLHYSLFAVIPGLIGGVLTSVLALILAKPFGSLGLADYEPFAPEFTLPVWIALAGVAVPTLIYWLCGILKIGKLLKRDTVELLGNKVGNDGKAKKILARKKAKVKVKMAVRSLAANPGRSLVVFLGVFLGAVIVAFAFSFIDSVKAVGEQAHGEFGSFKYEYILNTLEDGNPSDGEAVLVAPFESKDGKRFSVMGVDGDNTLWNLTTQSGNRADTENGWYMSSLCAAIFGLEEGDEFTFVSIASLEEKTVRINGIIKNGYQNYIVSSREKAAEIAGLAATKYNAVLSDRELAIDGSSVMEIISDTTYETQMDNMLRSMSGMVYAMMIIGGVVCVAALYAVINLMVSENASSISMLKVLGMEDRRINSMIISANHLLLIPGIAVGILAAYGGMAWYSSAFVDVENLIIPATLKWSSVLITIAATSVCYFVSLLLVRRKVGKTDMVESLKDNRE